MAAPDFKQQIGFSVTDKRKKKDKATTTKNVEKTRSCKLREYFAMARFLKIFLKSLFSDSKIKFLSMTPNPVDTRLRFNVYKTSIRCRRRRIDVL